MSDISVIGLGLMGAALARAIKRAGHDLVVWNRSPARVQPFRDDGVACAPDVATAIQASPVALVCIDNDATTRALLGAAGVASHLAGKTIVQLSSSTPAEAEAAAAWMAERGATYLDGAILAGPGAIGTNAARIILSGDEAAHQAAIPLLDCLGQGTVSYLGPNVRQASALDLAWLMQRYGAFMSSVHAANLCKSEGVGLDNLMGVLDDASPLQGYLPTLRDGTFDEFGASLAVWRGALGKIQAQAVDAGINGEIPDFFASVFDRAIDAGYGQKNVMALFKVLEKG